MTKLSDEQKEKILSFAERGKKGQWISAKLDLSSATVAYQMLRAGYDPWDTTKSTRPNQRGAFGALEDARILELAKTMGPHRIAREIGRPKTSVVIRLMTLEVRAEAALRAQESASDG